MAQVPTQKDDKEKKNDQLATAILKDKAKPNRLIVDQVRNIWKSWKSR